MKTVNYKPHKDSDFTVKCKVTKTKTGYGKTFYLIEPVEGYGTKWTNKVEVEDENTKLHKAVH